MVGAIALGLATVATVMIIGGDRVPAPLAAAPREAPGDDERGAALEGEVLDADLDAPIEAARVTVQCGEEEPLERASDALGRFTFEGLPGGSCTVTAGAEGYRRPGPDPALIREVTLVEGETLRGLALGLYAAATVSGQVVVGDDGIAGAALTLLYLEAPEVSEAFTVSVEQATTAGGTFELAGLSPGRLQVLAEHADHALGESRAFFLAPGGRVDDVVVSLAAGGTVSGRVFDSAGRPVAAARVELRLEGGGRRRPARTDEAGHYLLDGVAPGEHTVRAAAHGLRPAERRVEVLAGEETRADLTLSSRDGLGGVVLSPEGEPVPRAAVHTDDPEAGHGPAATTDARGRFWIGWRPAAGRHLWATHPAYATSAKVRPGAVAATPDGVTLTLRAGGRMVGRVVDPAGRPVSVYRAEARPEGRRARPRVVQVSDASGAFEISDLAPGRWGLRIGARGYPPVAFGGFEIVAGGVTDAGTVTLEAGGTVVGQIVDAASGEPVASAFVRLSGSWAAGFSGTGPTTRSDAEGRFALTGLPPGRVSIRVQHRGYIPRVASGTAVAPNDIVDAGTIPLSRASSTADARRMQYSGVGAVLQQDGDGLLVRQAFDGAPASDAGLTKGTRILGINGTPSGELDLRRAVELIRGETGTDVTLEVRRPGSDVEEIIRIQRGEVVTPPAPQRPQHRLKQQPKP